MYKPRGWQTLRLAEPGHQGWHAIMLAARSHSFPVPLVPSTTLRIPGSLERGFWGWSTDSGFPTTWADHYPRPLAQLFPAPEKAVGSPVCECVCVHMRTHAHVYTLACAQLQAGLDFANVSCRGPVLGQGFPSESPAVLISPSYSN